jgi:ABC-type branched-subunit amino acid transport system substrate-binding protein
MRRPMLQLVAAIAALSLFAAACGDDDDEPAGDTTTTEEEASGDAFTIGRVLPETGSLAPLGPPMIEGTDLAIEDINAAGGVLGNDVEFLRADEGADAVAAREATTRLLGEGAQAIVGAASSDASQEIIQQLFDDQIPQCSGSNTSPAFSDQANAEFYFRTVPPDEAVTPIIADTVIGDGHASVAVVARADDYGNALADLVETALTESGAEVAAKVTYDPNASTFDAEVGQITGANPDAVVVISFAEGAQLIAGMLEEGFEPDQFYGSDGLFAPTIDEEVDPNNPAVIEGMKVVGAAGGEEFNDRIAEATDNNFIYGGQTYDCAIVLALAAEAAGSTEGPAILEQVTQVTNDGTVCTSFEECKRLLGDDENIDYEGASGPLNLDDVGDPTFERYAVAEFTAEGSLRIESSEDVDLAELGG